MGTADPWSAGERAGKACMAGDAAADFTVPPTSQNCMTHPTADAGYLTQEERCDAGVEVIYT